MISAFDLEDQVAHSTAWLPRLLQEMPHWQQSPDVFFVLGDLLLDWAMAHPAQAEQELLPLVESAWSTCLALGEQPQLEGSVQGRGSFLAAHNLAVLHEQMGRVEQAREYQQLAHELREGQGKACVTRR